MSTTALMVVVVVDWSREEYCDEFLCLRRSQRQMQGEGEEEDLGREVERWRGVQSISCLAEQNDGQM